MHPCSSAPKRVPQTIEIECAPDDDALYVTAHQSPAWTTMPLDIWRVVATLLHDDLYAFVSLKTTCTMLGFALPRVVDIIGRTNLRPWCVRFANRVLRRYPSLRIFYIPPKVPTWRSNWRYISLEGPDGQLVKICIGSGLIKRPFDSAALLGTVFDAEPERVFTWVPDGQLRARTVTEMKTSFRDFTHHYQMELQKLNLFTKYEFDALHSWSARQDYFNSRYY